MTSAMFVLALFLAIPLVTFILCFFGFAAESIPREGYAPDPDDGVLKSAVMKIIVAELVMFILLIPVAIKPPPVVSDLKLIDAGHADMTSYWVAVVIIMLLTPILTPPIYWGMYWVLACVYWLSKALYAAVAGFIEWWGEIIFKNKD